MTRMLSDSFLSIFSLQAPPLKLPRAMVLRVKVGSLRSLNRFVTNAFKAWSSALEKMDKWCASLSDSG